MDLHREHARLSKRQWEAAGEAIRWRFEDWLWEPPEKSGRERVGEEFP